LSTRIQFIYQPFGVKGKEREGKEEE